MRTVGLCVAIATIFSSPVFGAPGDKWILGIDHIDNFGFFETYTGAGYSGPQSSGNPSYIGNAYGPPITCTTTNGCKDGTARIYWSLSGLSTSGTSLSSEPQLYSIKFYGTSAPANNDWQPIEVDFNGPGPGDGEGQIDPNIPWQGQFGTNHQWIGADAKVPGQWNNTGPGPQAPKSDAYNASGFDGTYMWLQPGSYLYAKWNFPGATRRSWSTLELTQVTPTTVPSPLGDYNKNGVVDAADYALWRKTYDDETPAANRPADGNLDGYVDDYDYDIWRQHFGNPGGQGTGIGLSPVPEPTAIGLGMVGLSLYTLVHGRRKRAAN